MSDRARLATFAASAAVVLAAWILLTVTAPDTSSAPAVRPARPAAGAAPLAAAGPARGKATVVVSDRPASSSTPAAAAAPIPPEAWAAARRFARSYVRGRGMRGARLLRVAATDDPTTAELEMAATLRRRGVRTTLILILTARGGRWRVTAVR